LVGREKIDKADDRHGDDHRPEPGLMLSDRAEHIAKLS
jgi:hypothetical protein